MKQEDIELLTSQEFIDAMSDFCTGVLRTSTTVKLTYGNELAYTDGNTIYINPLHPYFEGLTVEEIATYLLGLRLHECLHPEYTAFSLVREAYIKRADDKPGYRELFRSLFNTNEDGRIERIGSDVYVGIAYSLYFVNSLIKKKGNEAKAKHPEISDSQIIMDMIWNKALMNTESICPDHLVTYWEQIKGLIKEARTADDCKTCFDRSKAITDIVYPLFESELAQSQLQEQIKMLSGGKSQSNSGGYGRDADTKGKDILEVQDDEDSETNKGAGSKGEGSDEEKNSQSSGSGAECSSSGDGKDTPNGDVKSGAPFSQQDIEQFSNIIESIVQNARLTRRTNVENAKYNEQNLKELQSAINSATKSNSTKLIRVNEKNNKVTVYNEAKKKHSGLIKKFIRQLREILNYNQDEVDRFRANGAVDGRSLSRLYSSGHIFRKRFDKDEESNLCITIAADTSGSMSSEMKRQIEMLVILSEVFIDLDIPYSILGFGAFLTAYSLSSEKGINRKFNISQMAAAGGTPMKEITQIVKTHIEKSCMQYDNIVFIVTDGEPYDIEGTKKTIQELKCKNLVYGFGLDCSESNMKYLFGNEYFSIDSLNLLPKIVCEIVKKNLLKQDF